MMNPVLLDEWYLIKYDDHDMAKAVILTEEASNAVVDKARVHGKEDGELSELSSWTDNVTELWQIPSRRLC